jgi:hypothetical protein
MGEPQEDGEEEAMMRCGRCGESKPKAEFYDRIPRGNCRACQRRAVLDWRKQFPERHAAHKAVQGAVKDGRLVRPNKCERCSQERYTVAHHEDHGRPLDVTWLCDLCQRAEKKLKPLSLFY